MFTRFRISLGLALIVSLFLIIPAFAGGWAVISLDEMPANVVAGEPLKVGFTVLQHGKTPLDGLSPTITAHLDKSNDFVVRAEADGKPGHYTATLNFSKEGEWQWSIQAFTMDQHMPALHVAAPAAVNTNPPPAKTASPTIPGTPLQFASGLLLITGAIGGVIAFRRKSRPALAFTVVCMLVGIALPMAGTGRAFSGAQPVSDAAEQVSVSQVEFGRQLFIAKGCITCHYNSRAGSPDEYWTIEMGAPNLSTFSANPEIIYMRLKDPSSVKSDTKMPDLGLKKDEIEALVAFINSK